MRTPQPDPSVARRRLHERRDELAARIRRVLGEEGALVSERDPELEELAARHGLAEAELCSDCQEMVEAEVTAPP